MDGQWLGGRILCLLKVRVHDVEFYFASGDSLCRYLLTKM